MEKDKKDKPKNEKPVENPFGSKPGQKNKGKFNIYWVYALIAIGFFAIQYYYSGGGAEEITWAKFEKEMLLAREVEKIVIVNKERADIYIKKDKLELPKYKKIFEKNGNKQPRKGPHFYFTIGSIEVFEQRLDEAQKEFAQDEKVSVSYHREDDTFGTILSYLLPIALLIGVWIFIFRRMNGPNGPGGQIFSIGKSKAKMFDKDNAEVKIDFKDVAGLDEAKVEIKEIVEFLKIGRAHV